MKTTLVIILGIILLGIITWTLVWRGHEAFQDGKKPIDPQKMLERVQGILDKIDNPALVNHFLNVMDKDPGQLARMQLTKA
jgi:hypothetical protein